MNIDSNHNANPIGILAAAGAVTLASLIPTLTMWFQFGTAVIGFSLAVYGAVQTVKKIKANKSKE